MTIRRWATRGLRQGDLTALKRIARGAAGLGRRQAERLRRRGFVARRKNGRPAVTVHGRLALLVKTLSIHA